MVRGVWRVFGILVAAACVAGVILPERGRAATTEPNVVVVLTDDQRWDTLSAMPILQEKLAGEGVTFANAFVTNPVCCPSRVSFLTGQYSQTTRIYTNPAFPFFDDSSTLATWLNAAGYRTGLFGKYLIGYSGTYIPPGWDQWVAFSPRPNYYDYQLNVNGSLQQYGALGADYSTDVIARSAEAFVRSTRTKTPLFLVLTPFAPHGRSGDRLEALPAPRHAGMFAPPALEPWRPPSYDELDVSDKPAWVKRLPLLTPERQARGDAFRQSQLEALQAVDDAVGRIVDALEDTGRLDNSIVVYTSDNGLHWGEHRWLHKEAAYEESIRVPLVVRYDPLTAKARSDGHIVANVDLAPTIAGLAGVTAPGAEGRSLVPFLEQRGVQWRNQLLIENVLRHWPHRTWCGFRTTRHTYLQYKAGEEELYDLALDPYQLQNLAGDPVFRRTIVRFRQKVVSGCNPPPPEFVPRSPCLVAGGPKGNELVGTRYYDLICAGDGNDRVSARADDDHVFGGAGSDVLRGDAGNDVLAGGGGFDRLLGGDGKDRIAALDHQRDVVDCGPGIDTARVHPRDLVRRCETVERR